MKGFNDAKRAFPTAVSETSSHDNLSRNDQAQLNPVERDRQLESIPWLWLLPLAQIERIRSKSVL
jgi:hypothetical protein